MSTPNVTCRGGIPISVGPAGVWYQLEVGPRAGEDARREQDLGVAFESIVERAREALERAAARIPRRAA